MSRYSVKPGRGPSAFGAVGDVIGAVFGVIWIVFAIWLTADAPWPLVKIIFPLFGVVAVIASIASAVYHTHNATQPNRFSEFDVVPSDSEPDPVFDPQRRQTNIPSAKFCSNCGSGLRTSDRFCSSCGQRAAD